MLFYIGQEGMCCYIKFNRDIKIYFCYFKEIRNESHDYPHRVAKFPENRNRNRYRDVSPCKYCGFMCMYVFFSLFRRQDTVEIKGWGQIDQYSNFLKCVFLFVFFETGLHYIVQAVLEVTLQHRVTSNLQQSSCFSLQNVGIVSATTAGLISTFSLICARTCVRCLP